MKIECAGAKRSFVLLAILMVFLVSVSSCSSGGGGGGGGSQVAPNANIEVTVNGEPVSVSPGLLICALNLIDVDWSPDDNATMTQVRIELVGTPSASAGSGFLDVGADYGDPASSTITVDASGGGPISKNFKVDVPDPSGTGEYIVRITATADDSFTDYPAEEFAATTADNPCLQSFYDTGSGGGDVEGDAKGYAADAPPIDVPGEIVQIAGYNISANPDAFFLMDAVGGEYPVTDLSPVSGPDADGLVTIQGLLSAGCGQLNDLGVRNTAYPHPITSSYIDESAQTLEDVYTYTPVITQIDPANGSCLGGEPVTIYGGGFLEGATATIEGNEMTDYTVTCSQITGNTPPTPPLNCGEGVSVAVENPGDDADSFSADLFDFEPEILAVDPEYGPLAGGTVFTISGCGFLEGAAVTVDGNPPPAVTTTVVEDCETITATTPRGEDDHLGELVPVVAQNPSGYSDSEDLYTYASRNINPAETNYSNASLLGRYNWIAIVHDFTQSVPYVELLGEASMTLIEDGLTAEAFVTSVGSDFKPAFAPIDGGSATFVGDGTYEVSAGADEFYVWNDDVPTLANANGPAREGSYEMAEDGTLTIDGYKTGALAPDGNALFAASTIYQIGSVSELYVFTREGTELDPVVPVDLNGKTMGMVAFVHEYGFDEWDEIPFETTRGFKGVVNFGTSTFTVTPLDEKFVSLYDWWDLYSYVSTGEDATGRYSADTSGLFSMTFDPAYDEDGLFNSDEVFGIFTVTDNPNPEDAQLFVGVNLATPPSGPIFITSLAPTSSYPSPTGIGRSLILFMVPLSTEGGKNAASFADQLEEDLGWTQALFGHEFVEDWEVYLPALWTRDATTLYQPTELDEGTVTENVTQGSIVTEMTWSSLAAASNVYGFGVSPFPYDGEFTVFEEGYSPVVEGFISEDNSVNINVDMNEEYINSIRVELEK
jgi:hypothetical protein